MFDAILVQEGMEELVAKGRDMRFGNGGVKVLGKRLLQPIESRFSTVRLISLVVMVVLMRESGGSVEVHPYPSA